MDAGKRIPRSMTGLSFWSWFLTPWSAAEEWRGKVPVSVRHGRRATVGHHCYLGQIAWFSSFPCWWWKLPKNIQASQRVADQVWDLGARSLHLPQEMSIWETSEMGSWIKSLVLWLLLHGFSLFSRDDTGSAWASRTTRAPSKYLLLFPHAGWENSELKCLQCTQ